MTSFIAIDRSTGNTIAKHSNKAELINVVAEKVDDGTRIHVCEIVHSLEISTETVKKTIVTDDDGREMIVDARGRIVPVKRNSKEEPDAVQIAVGSKKEFETIDIE